jgi:hypothetical protein
LLRWLEEWNGANCDGEREHVYGIKIDTIDNPGWSVSIDLAGTALEPKAFTTVSIDKGDCDWILCRIGNKIFEGAGDPFKLENILTIFREWAEDGTQSILRTDSCCI